MTPCDVCPFSSSCPDCRWQGGGSAVPSQLRIEFDGRSALGGHPGAPDLIASLQTRVRGLHDENLD